MAVLQSSRWEAGLKDGKGASSTCLMYSPAQGNSIKVCNGKTLPCREPDAGEVRVSIGARPTKPPRRKAKESV